MRAPLALDTETFLLTPMVKAPRLVCVSYAGQDVSSGLMKWDEQNTYECVRAWLDEAPIIVGQNVSYDFAVLAAQWPDLLPAIFAAYDADRITDTMLRQKLIDIAHGELDAPQHRVGKGCYSLEALAMRHLGKQLDKDTWRLRYSELVDVPLAEWPEGARVYPVEDAITTLQVYEAQNADDESAYLLQDQFRQARHAFWLHLMSCWGIRTDREAVARLAASLGQDLAKVTSTLLAAGLLKPKTKKPDAPLQRDTKAAKARMVAIMGGEHACALTEGGGVSLDEDACRASKDALLIAYTDYTRISAILSKDIEALQTGEIHPRFNSLLNSGRTSAGGSAEDGGYNVQNPARKGGVRECFVPRPGWLFVDSDYDGLELRTMSQACLELVGESAMADVLNAGKDVHIDLAADMLGISYEACLSRYEAKDPEVKEARQFAKIGNFGLAGGMGAKTFVDYAASNGINITLEKAYEIKAAWLRKWPEFTRYFAMAGELTADGNPGQIVQLYSGRVRGGMFFSELCNTYFQGLGADASKAAGWAISRACYDVTVGSILYGCRPVNYIHDQFLVEVPDDELAHDRAQEVARLMIQGANKWLPDVPATTTPCLSRAWYKDATAVYDADGRLVPYEPKPKEVEKKAA